MAPLSLGKLLICGLCQGMVSWRGGPDIKVYLFWCLGSLNDTGDWMKMGQVVSFWGEVSTFKEILVISLLVLLGSLIMPVHPLTTLSSTQACH